MRNLIEVIDQMITQIPSDEQLLINELYSNRESAEFSSPETMGLRWENTAEALEGLGEPPGGEPPWNEEWKNKVYDIWMGKQKES